MSFSLDTTTRRSIPADQTSRLVQVLLGAIWAIGGALMAFNPPPHDFRRGQQLPVIGFVVLVGGIYLAAKALRTPAVKSSGKPPRHASGKARTGDVVKLALGSTLGGAAGVSIVWWGISSGQLSAVGLGIAGLGMFVLAIPWAVSALNRLLRREKPQTKPVDMTNDDGDGMR